MEQKELVERREFKPGEAVLVSNTSEVLAANRKDSYRYVGMDHSGLHIVENEKGTLSRWQFAVSPVRVVPWTYDTLPRLPFIVSYTEGEAYKSRWVVVGANLEGVFTGEGTRPISYDDLLKDFEYIPDQHSGKGYPCGETVGGLK